MTEDQKQARAAKARAARAAAAKKRSDALEKTQLDSIKSIWGMVEQCDREPLTYIEKQIASGERTPEDVAFLRETRSIYMAKYRHHLGVTNDKHEDTQ